MTIAKQPVLPVAPGGKACDDNFARGAGGTFNDEAGKANKESSKKDKEGLSKSIIGRTASSPKRYSRGVVQKKIDKLKDTNEL
jgi:hypothetical protein